ncbi:salivary protein Is3, putative, partial [Ixodes scapularis]
MMSSLTVVVLGLFIAVIAVAQLVSSFPDNRESQNLGEILIRRQRCIPYGCTYGRWRRPDGTLCRIRYRIYGFCKNGICSIPSPPTTTARPVPPPKPTQTTTTAPPTTPT